VRITEDQYEGARVILDWTSNFGNLPKPSTMRRTILPAIRDYSYARSVFCSLRTNNNETTDDSSMETKNGASEGHVRLVFPSEWALLDCQMGPIFESIAGERTGIRALSGFRLIFSDIEETPIGRKRRQFLDTSSQIFVHPPCKNIAQQEDRLPLPVMTGDTVSITLLHSEDVRAVMGCGQAVILNHDANELRGLIETIRGVWIIEDGHPVTDPYDAEQKASFSFFSMPKNGDTIAELIPGWTEDSGEGVYNLYLLVYRFCRTIRGEATNKLVITKRSTP
jgi:hypothetical protein